MSLMVEKLAYLKKCCRMTTEQAAQLSQIPVGTLNKIFSGQTKHPAAEHLDRLSRVFRVSTHYLLDDELPTECCFSGETEEGLFHLSAEEVHFVCQYRRLSSEGRQALAAMASLLRIPAGALAGTVPVKRTFCYAAPTLDGCAARPLRPILLPETDPAVRQADFTVLLGDGCMEPLYPSGSVVLCRRGMGSREDYGVYQLNQALLLRRLLRRRGVTQLVGPNLGYQDIVVSDDDYLDCLGVVIGLVCGYRWG